MALRNLLVFLFYAFQSGEPRIASSVSAAFVPCGVRRGNARSAFHVPCSHTASCSLLKFNKRSRRWKQRGVLGSTVEDSIGIGASSWYRSHVAFIKSCNLAGIVNDEEETKEITIKLGDGPNLVAVTGETGSGKSLLIARVAEICTGGKATSSYIPSSGGNIGPSSNATVEMVFRLSEPHLSRIKGHFDRFGLDQSLLENDETHSMGTLTLKRILSLGNTPALRLKSSCEVNGQPVTLKVLKTIAAPLLAIVDAAAAATALAKPNPRLAVLDTAVPFHVMSEARNTMLQYRQCRLHREKLEQELASRVLPPSFSVDENGENDLKLLQHWVDELSSFEDRMLRFSGSLSVSAERGDPFLDAVHALTTSAWSSNSVLPGDNTGVLFSSLMYENLLRFREAVKSLDSQLQAARSACDALGALSLPDSAKTALERARSALFDAAGVDAEEGALFDAAERSHELLNGVEEALKACIRSMESDNRGLIHVLEDMRSKVDISLDDLDAIIGEWNTLARKHAISPYVLPSCHMALRSELDGNVETRSLLPKAIEDEQAALTEFEEACQALTNARLGIAKRLSMAVSQRMPALGFGESTFEALFHPAVRKCTDGSVFRGGSAVGVDAVDFILHHGDSSEMSQTPNSHSGTRNDNGRSQRGGKLEVVASSGEKARILLAIETKLPGSIGASCSSSERGSGDVMPEDGDSSCPPVAVIYDEIDAHVGGRASVSVADMLADQSRRREGAPDRARSQVVSITHSPSVAAVADCHVVIHKQAGSRVESQGHAEGTVVSVQASSVEGLERRKELARMASGDLAVDEAEVFADALIRDGAKRRQQTGIKYTELHKSSN